MGEWLLSYKNVGHRRSVSLFFVPVVQYESNQLFSSCRNPMHLSTALRVPEHSTFGSAEHVSCVVSLDLMTPTEQMKGLFDISWGWSTDLGVAESAPTHQLGWREQGRSSVVAAHTHRYPVVKFSLACIGAARCRIESPVPVCLLLAGLLLWVSLSGDTGLLSAVVTPGVCVDAPCSASRLQLGIRQYPKCEWKEIGLWPGVNLFSCCFSC